MPDYSAVIVLLGDGQGNVGNYDWAGPVAAISSNPTAAADLNGDGDIDLVSAPGALEGYESVGVMLGDGHDGCLSQYPSYYAVGGTPDAAILGDFDRDGKLDIAAAVSANNDVSIVRGRATARSRRPRTSPSAPAPMRRSQMAISMQTAGSMPPITSCGAKTAAHAKNMTHGARISASRPVQVPTHDPLHWRLATSMATAGSISPPLMRMLTASPFCLMTSSGQSCRLVSPLATRRSPKATVAPSMPRSP